VDVTQESKPSLYFPTKQDAIHYADGETMITVNFQYFTGIKRRLFHNARLSGDWSAWDDVEMQEHVAEDGCPAFEAVVTFDDAMAGREFRWGVRLDGPGGAHQWGIATEAPAPPDLRPERTAVLPPGGGHSTERYYLTVSRMLGAQKYYRGGKELIRFAVWAPNARQVEVVFGYQDRGYIDDNGKGVDPARPAIQLQPLRDGIWASEPIADFASYVGALYMYRIRTAQGVVKYRTDLHSRWQIGRGAIDPAHAVWDGDPQTLDGGVSCSVVIDQDVVREEFEPSTDPPRLITDAKFWSSEFTPQIPVPTRLTELVIYELHVGSLGYGRTDPGNLQDAMAFIPHLVSLGVNAVELMPVSETGGVFRWGYGDTHHFVIESSAGGRDKFKHFVRECHRHGIAVIQDVVYNHFDNAAERAQWAYDSTQPEENIYYWYEGSSTHHADPDNGYLQNGSSGRTPRLWEENVRQLFTSSAAEFVEEFHVDGFRVDLTDAIHAHHWHEKIGVPVNEPNLYGQKMLREWSRSLDLIRPSELRIAEDHSGWQKMTEPTTTGGMGFNATWDAAFYHDLIGDAAQQGGRAKVLHRAGFGTDAPLPWSQFCDSLARSAKTHVVYHESHDEAGNAEGTMRTLCVAVNNAALIGATRQTAEARVRVVAGLTLLSAGTPMFFMGKEVGATQICSMTTSPQVVRTFPP
jgi:1,4-alpha-glucan branching enzyme